MRPDAESEVPADAGAVNYLEFITERPAAELVRSAAEVHRMAEVQQPGERYWSVVEPFWHAVSIYDGGDNFAEQFQALPSVAGHLFAAHWCQSEVCNGGLYQFFSNPTGVLAPEALAGFQAIGLSEWAAVLTEAMRFFGEPYPRDQAHRLELLAGHPGKQREEWDPFYVLDERFYYWLHAEPDRWEREADRFAIAPDVTASTSPAINLSTD